MLYYYNYDFPIGKLMIMDDGHGICGIHFHNQLNKDCIKKETHDTRMAAYQLTEYFSGDRTEFDLPLSLHGTEFQQKVWNALREIPYGETRTYKEIAEIVGSPKGCRAVGMANNRNPIAIVIPCHRVIGNNGSLTGYAGGLELKEYLLELEHAL